MEPIEAALRSAETIRLGRLHRFKRQFALYSGSHLGHTDKGRFQALPSSKKKVALK